MRNGRLIQVGARKGAIFVSGSEGGRGFGSRVGHHYVVQGRSPTSGERPFSLVNQWVTVWRRPERSPGSQAEAGEQTGEQNPKRVDWRRLFPRFRGEDRAKPLEVFPHVDRRTVP